MNCRWLVVECLVCRQTETGDGSFEEKDDHYFTARE
jgi:hypothetical protein